MEVKETEESKILQNDEGVGELVETNEDVVLYKKEHLKRVYTEGVKEAHRKKKIVSVTSGIKRLKPISFIDGVPNHSFKARKYFKDVVFMTLVVTSSRHELQWYNSYEKDEKFSGYCFSEKLNKLLRVYDGKCYKAIGDTSKKDKE